jgi:hypothetical protein
MKKTILFLFACAILCGISSRSVAQDADAMKKWMDYMTPGEMHKMLASMSGKWSEEVTVWMDPSQPPMKTTSTMENKMILGGRYQQSNISGSFNGMPYEAESVIGYDNMKKMFAGSLMDNMGTGIMNMEGPYDAATKTIDLTGSETDPMTGKGMKMRQTIKIIDDNNEMIAMYSVTGDKEVKIMEIKLKRM